MFFNFWSLLKAVCALKNIHVVHEFLEIANSNFCAISATTCQNEQLDKGCIGDVVVLGLIAQNFNDIMLFVANFFAFSKSEEVLEGQWFDS